jgi:hypothetical protein
MPALISRMARRAAFRRPAALAGLAAAAIAAALLYPAAPAGASAAAPGGAPPGNGGCVTTFQPPDTWTVVCGNGGGTPGGPGGGGGGGGGGGKVTCTLQPLSPAQISFLGLPPAPKGEEWAAITCPGTSPFGGVTLVADGAAAPAVTPQELLQEVEGQLTVPVLHAATAPPRGKDGLVGLPEWFWIAPGNWHPIRTQRLQVGAVWAQVTATPEQLSFVPGGGLPGRACPGPGTVFSSQAPDQTSDCSFTYSQSSATQEGGTYAASVAVTWRVTWAGFSPATGPVGGVLNAGLQVADPINLRVAEGQALVNGTGVGQ